MLENRLHFRLHAAIQTLKTLIAGADDVELYDDDAQETAPSPDDEGFSSLPHSNGNHGATNRAGAAETGANGPASASKTHHHDAQIAVPEDNGDFEECSQSLDAPNTDSAENNNGKCSISQEQSDTVSGSAV